MKFNIVLASNSPRRREILEMLGWNFVVDGADIDESMDESLSLEDRLKDLAYRKAEAIVDKYEDKFIIAADTIVLAGGSVLGKPQDEDDARRMLRLSSAEPHYVYTAVCILNKTLDMDVRFIEKTKIEMSPMSEEEIDWYIATGESFDKAGAYAIQGRGGVFISRVEGDYYNIVGLPINKLYHELKKYVNFQLL